IVIALLIASSSSEPIKGHHDDINSLIPYFKTWHVHTINGLSNGKMLLVHCKSKDNDLGIHNLTAGAEFSWQFKLSVTGRTLFWCYMAYDNFHAALNPAIAYRLSKSSHSDKLLENSSGPSTLNLSVPIVGGLQQQTTLMKAMKEQLSSQHKRLMEEIRAAREAPKQNPQEREDETAHYTRRQQYGSRSVTDYKNDRA
ncbi:hypothetical protein Gotri_013372, partial [Gossypium trilobum]|nr:hypothetical protein [Gossypium trilobum]